jgi:hypothetical protein
MARVASFLAPAARAGASFLAVVAREDCDFLAVVAREGCFRAVLRGLRSAVMQEAS